MKSLRRTLAVRFAMTMLVALTLIAGWTYVAVRRSLRQQQDAFARDVSRLVVTRDAPGVPDSVTALQVATSLEPLEALNQAVLYGMVAVVVMSALATLVGAGWLAGSAVLPLAEIAAQAQAIRGGAPGERITVHADVEECRNLVAILNDMLSRLDRTHDWHRRIIRDLGHDLRTPIAALRAEVEVGLWTERTPDAYRGVLASALEEVDRLTLISDALVMLGRVESGELTPRWGPIDAGAIAAAAVARGRERAGARRFVLAMEPGLAPLQADGRLLGIVLDQLVDNALRYTPPDATVEIGFAARDDRVDLWVEDDGPGVPEEIRPHLFERFFRVDAARGRDAGPGLGLTLAAEIVRLHGGSITAGEGPAGGLRIDMSFPREHPADIAGTPGTHTASPPVAEVPATSHQ